MKMYRGYPFKVFKFDFYEAIGFTQNSSVEWKVSMDIFHTWTLILITWLLATDFVFRSGTASNSCKFAVPHDKFAAAETIESQRQAN